MVDRAGMAAESACAVRGLLQNHFCSKLMRQHLRQNGAPMDSNVIAWLVVGALCLSTIGAAIASRLPPVLTWQVGRLAKRVGLRVLPELEDRLRARVAARMLGGAVGGLAGLTVAAIVELGSGARTGTVFVTTVGVFGIAGYLLGTTWASFAVSFARPAGARVARLTTVSLSSYVPSLARLVAWALLGLAVVAVAIAAAGQDPVRAAVLAPVVAVVALVLVALEVLGRRLVLRGQAAASSEELVWDDALRSSALNEVLDGVRQTVLLTVVASGVLLSSSSSWWFVLPLLVLAVGTVVLARMIRVAWTWYLEQLWSGPRRRAVPVSVRSGGASG